ncbi:hypothetical protein CA13_68120 [Planctomycetes bacterium CA13]|uniref:Exostosin family protein n=1 Tax=Novipirellula herctigrandis TaxID=2527986 RepID=A0A5C5YN91_9BACT|nr:hypothetical protein CA13_68120 [Planctomycetes bacterium CA13]
MELKNIVRFPIDIQRANRLLGTRNLAIHCQENQSNPLLVSDPNPSQRPIVLDLYTPQMLFDCGRHFASLAHFCNQIGSRFFVRSSRMVLAGIARKVHGAEMLADPNAYWIGPDSDLPHDAFVLSDAAYEKQTRPGTPHHSLEMLIGRDIPRDLPVMPYPMHPATLRCSDDLSSFKLREHRSRSGVLFAGSQKSKYGHDKMQQQFGVLSRLDLLKVIQQWAGDRADGSVPIVLRDSGKAPIESKDWLPFLAKHSFFVCCPGAAQPMCHNLIEAMSVGTIPLIEYGDRMRPELEDGVTAVCFRGADGLHDALDRIDQMPPKQVETLSRSVAQYYDQHLCGKRFLKSLRDETIDVSLGQVVMPFHSENFYGPLRAWAA